MTDPPPIIILIFYHLSSRKALRQQSERPGIRGLIFSISLVESLAPSVGASRDSRPAAGEAFLGDSERAGVVEGTSDALFRRSVVDGERLLDYYYSL